jgi:hypothetical protein
MDRRSRISLALYPGYRSCVNFDRHLPESHHPSPRSRRSFAQYSSRFLISRSKPRSGGS